MHPTIVATGTFGQAASEILAPFGRIVVAPDGREESLLPLVDDAIALVVRGEGVASRKIIERAKPLKVIGRTGVGYNNIDIEAATERKIPVVFTPGANARVVAEASIALLLAACKRVVYWDRQLKSGNWSSRNNFSTMDMDGATLGIVGFGSIGQILAELAQPFRMRMLAYDPYVDVKRAESLGVELTGFDALMREANYICLHAILNEETRGLINRKSLQLVKRGAILLNLARGELIESLDVLEDALDENRLAAVGLDVFAPEPPDVSHPIFARENCLTSPHALGMTKRGMSRIFRQMAEDMAAILNGGRPRHAVNPEVFE